jgi:hypothetical protein
MVSVALVTTGYFIGNMQTRINGLQDVNQQSLLSATAERLVTNCGAPSGWGSNEATIPSSFGLADSNSINPYVLDVDKVCRLNSLNNFSLSYFDVSKSARLQTALGISISPMLSITVAPVGNVPSEASMTYTFQISVSGRSGPTSATLHCYAIAADFLATVNNETSEAGVGFVTVQIPNASTGPALLVVFARSHVDDRLTSFEVYSFAHQSAEPLPNNSFLDLSPLNYTLTVNPKNSGTVIESSYALSFDLHSDLALVSENVYTIPAWLDKSPTVLVFWGTGGSSNFAEWTSYPQVPLQFGADFSESDVNVFTYTVAIQENLYLLSVRFGDVVP